MVVQSYDQEFQIKLPSLSQQGSLDVPLFRVKDRLECILAAMYCQRWTPGGKVVETELHRHVF